MKYPLRWLLLVLAALGVVAIPMTPTAWLLGAIPEQRDALVVPAQVIEYKSEQGSVVVIYPAQVFR